MNWNNRFKSYLKTGNMNYADSNYKPVEDKIKLIAKSKVENKTKDKKKVKSLLKNLVKGIAQDKPIFKKQNLQVEVPYQKGELILRQRSPFFKDEYTKEKNILSWN